MNLDNNTSNLNAAKSGDSLRIGAASKPVVFTQEIQVYLTGLERSIKVKILSNEQLSDRQMHAALEKNVDRLKQIIAQLEPTRESCSVEIFDTGRLHAISLVDRELTSAEKTRIDGVLRTFKDAVESEPARAAALPDPMLRETEKQIAEWNVLGQIGLSEDKIRIIARAILLTGSTASQLAKETKSKVLIGGENPDIRIVATKTGKFHIQVSTLGKGHFKDTHQFIKIGELGVRKIQETARSRAKESAVAISTEKQTAAMPNSSVVDELTLREHQNEVQLHQDLTEIRKKEKQSQAPDSFSHVATSTIITHLRADQSPQIALMGKLFNGGTVDEHLIKENLSLPERAFICSGFLRGVAQLHALNIIHRDIKSDNILLEIREQTVPANEWPAGITPQNVPPGFKVELKQGNLESVKKIEIVKAVLCDLGKGTYIDEARKFRSAHYLFYNKILPPGRMTDERAYSKAFDLYAAGRTVYQIFANVPLSKLNGINTHAIDRAGFLYEITALLAQRAETTDPAQIKAIDQKLQILDQSLSQYDKLALGDPSSWPNWFNIPVKVRNFILRMIDIENPGNCPSAQECADFFGSLTASDLQLPPSGVSLDAGNIKNKYGGYL